MAYNEDALRSLDSDNPWAGIQHEGLDDSAAFDCHKLRAGSTDEDDSAALLRSLHCNTVRMNHEYSLSNLQQQ